MIGYDYTENFWTTPERLTPEALRLWAQNIADLHPDQPHRHGPFNTADLAAAHRDHGNLLCPGCGRYVAP